MYFEQFHKSQDGLLVLVLRTVKSERVKIKIDTGWIKTGGCDPMLPGIEIREGK
jgi:hypothetical protein